MNKAYVEQVYLSICTCNFFFTPLALVVLLPDALAESDINSIRPPRGLFDSIYSRLRSIDIQILGSSTRSSQAASRPSTVYVFEIVAELQELNMNWKTFHSNTVCICSWLGIHGVRLV